MELIHLSDENIQQLAEKNDKTNSHLNTCKLCSAKFSFYRKLGTTISNQPEPKLSNLFEMRVMSEIYSLQKNSPLDLEQLFTIGFAVTGSLSALIYLLVTTSIFGDLGIGLVNMFKQIPIITSFKPLLPISIAACLVFTLFFDSIVKKLNHKPRLQR